jgi:hypothetical protein
MKKKIGINYFFETVLRAKPKISVGLGERSINDLTVCFSGYGRTT